jgi:hypothetical protein
MNEELAAICEDLKVVKECYANYNRTAKIYDEQYNKVCDFYLRLHHKISKDMEKVRSREK